MEHTEVASARDVASEIERLLPGVGEVKLHKLLYYIQGYHLAWEESPAFAENIEAWENGPVVASLWRERKHGDGKPASPLPDSVRDITVNVLSRHRHLSGIDLIDATHAEDPWQRATDGGRCIANQVISHQSLIDYFSVEPEWVSHMREHVATIRDDQRFVPDPPGALDAIISKHFSG